MGAVLGWPTTDPVTLLLLGHVFFPLSRLWAAAHVAGGDPDAFRAAVPLEVRSEDTQQLRQKLARFEVTRATLTAITARWEHVFFLPTDTSPSELAALETARLDASHAHNATRRLFVRYLRRAPPRVSLKTQTPADVERIYGGAVRDVAAAFAPPSVMPPVAVSRAIPGTVGRDYWIRFMSPAMRAGGLVTARVHEPIGVIDPPTIILGHGICVEFDHWRGLADETDELVKRGFRVIRPEAPWHGRRAASGTYGGEMIVGAFPGGAIDAFTAALQEWAVIADWARRTSKGALTVGGTSLGAQMAQLYAERSRDWPQRLRPQALLLITHCGSMADAVLHGAIPSVFRTAPDMYAKGWTADNVAPYLALLDPARTAPLPPCRIVSVLGRYDTITPFASGEALVRDWKLPAENLHILDRGHFSVPMTLIRNHSPLDRFKAVVTGLVS